MAARGDGLVAAVVSPAVITPRRAGLRDDELKKAEQLILLLLEACERCSRMPAGTQNDWDIFLGDNWIRPGAIRCPTLVIHDHADRVVPFNHAEWALQSIDGADLLSVETGHLIWIGRDAARMHQRRVDFLRQHLP